MKTKEYNDKKFGELLQNLENSNKELIIENEKLKEENKAKDYELESLRQMFALLQKSVFGTKKENVEIPADQLSLFSDEELSDEIKEEIEKLKKDVTLSSKAVKKNEKTGFKRSITNNMETENIVYEKKDLTCDKCGSSINKIGEKIKYTEYKYIPAHFKQITHISVVYKCTSCGVNNDNAINIKETKTKRPFLTHSIASSSIVADVIFQKFFQGTPLYRQEKIWADKGLIVRRNNLANWVIKSSEYYLKILVDIMRSDLMKCNVLHADETSIQVLKETDKKATSDSFMWVIAAGKNEKIKAVVFNYNKTRSEDAAKLILGKFKNNLITDGYAAYNNLEVADHGGCWSHLRRKFNESITIIDKKQDVNCDGYIALKFCDKILKLEREISEINDPDKILKFRQDTTQKVVDDLYKWAEEISLKPTVSKKMSTALTYLVNQKNKLSAFLRNGAIPATNNLAERSIRPFAIGRKNWLFANSVDGANATAVIYSIIETAKLNEINIAKYLEYVLDEMSNLKEDATVDDLRKLLPYSKTLPADILNFKE